MKNKNILRKDCLKQLDKLQNPAFAKGMSFFKMFYVFLFGGFLGTAYEELLVLSRTGVYSARHGVFYGPFNPLYGIGILLFVLVLKNFDRWYSCIIIGTVVGGVTEYVSSYLQEFFTGATSWNYCEKFLNINGRTTVIYALFWGVLGFVIAKFLYPPFSNMIEKIPYKLGTFISIALVLFVGVDIFISHSALIRLYLRTNGYVPLTFWGRICDKYFTAEYIKFIFPNMVLPI